MSASSPETSEKMINQVMSTLALAFRTRSAETLRELLPEDGRVFLSLSPPGDGSGYYGRDQVYFIFNKIYSERETIRFDIRPAGPASPGSEARNAAVPARCAASWSYRGADGRVDAVRIQFSFNVNHGTWTVSEIREAR